MAEYQVTIEMTEEELNWIVAQSRRRLGDLSNLEGELMKKLREFNSQRYRFTYQDDLRDKIGAIAHMYYDKEFVKHDGSPLLEGRDRAHCELALGYFIQEVDLIPDGMPFMGYLDDYLLISLLHDQLKIPLAMHRESKADRSAGSC